MNLSKKTFETFIQKYEEKSDSWNNAISSIFFSTEGYLGVVSCWRRNTGEGFFFGEGKGEINKINEILEDIYINFDKINGKKYKKQFLTIDNFIPMNTYSEYEQEVRLEIK